MNLLKFYDNTMECARLKNATNEMRCLRLKLGEEIDGDLDKYLLYKSKCEGGCDYGGYGFCAATIGLIIAIFGVVVAGLYALAGILKEGTVTVSFVYRNIGILLIVFIILVVIISLYSHHVFVNVTKYRKMKIVLEQMEEDFKSNKKSDD